MPDDIAKVVWQHADEHTESVASVPQRSQSVRHRQHTQAVVGLSGCRVVGLSEMYPYLTR